MSKYLISADIEGITGVINRDFSSRSGHHYSLGCRYMVSDVNAVIQGILNADSKAEIVVRDAHGSATNLNLEQLHPEARLVQGWEAVQNMLTGLDPDFSGVFLVGYHAGGQNLDAVLGHTMSSLVRQIKVDDTSINEAGLFGLYAGCHNVPVAFISGDDHAVAEAHRQLGEEVVGVAVKHSHGRGCAVSYSLATARALLEKHAADAVIKLQKKQLAPFRLSNTPVTEVVFYDAGVRVSVFRHLSQILAFDPIYRFDLDARSVTFNSGSTMEMLQRINLLLTIVFGIRATN